ncbi:MAG TPA: DNA modification methylase [Ktedonobacteraceae bacterium]|nr:DNA modification methylase [Ktedonobacteraceae bacterium]
MSKEAHKKNAAYWIARIEHRTVPIEQCIPHPRNPRQHPPDQISDLRASYRRFGQYRSLVGIENTATDGKTWIAAGCGTLQAMNEEHAPMVDVGYLPPETPEDVVIGIMVADNNLSNKAVDDNELLAALLEEQQNAGYDLASMGSDEETLRQMLESLGDSYLAGEREEGDGGDEFDADPEQVEVRCKVGEIYQLGRHRLACGDCTDLALVQRLMQGERAVCCWTDPPYGVSYVGKTKDALTIQNDGKEDIDAFLQRAFAAIDTALADGAAIYIAHPPGALCVTFGLRFLAQGWRLHETLVWVKDSMVLGHSDYHYRHEPIYFGYKPGTGRQGRGAEGWYGDNSQTTVFEIPRPKRSEEHPTMKPTELVQIMLLNSSPANGLVYDPFLGSGTTLIAGQRTKRRVYGCELDPRYASVVLDRYEAETGEEAQLLDRVEVTQ